MALKSKKPSSSFNGTETIFDDQTEDKAYQRYKHRCYRNLVLQGLLFFIYGLLIEFVLKTL